MRTLAKREKPVNSEARIDVFRITLSNQCMWDIDNIRRDKLRLIEKEAGSATNAASLLGMSIAQFSNLRDGAKDSKTGRPRGMRKETARRIEEAAGKPAGWLDQPQGTSLTEIPLDANPDYPAIRRVVFKLSAGASGFGVEYPQDEGAPIVFQREWFESRGYRPARLFAVRVANGSMEPGLNDGDTVVVDTDDTQPRDGVAFAINYEGELVVKRLVRDAGQWWLSSDNPNQAVYPRKVCDERSVILGRIVHKQSERI